MLQSITLLLSGSLLTENEPKFRRGRLLTIPSTHLSEMGQEGNALYSFTKTHFISKNSINTLGDTERQTVITWSQRIGFILFSAKRFNEDGGSDQPRLTGDTQYHDSESVLQWFLLPTLHLYVWLMIYEKNTKARSLPNLAHIKQIMKLTKTT